MKASVATVKLNSVNLNSVRMNMVELGRKTSRQSTLPAPVAWYDIEKEGKNSDSPDRSIVTDFSGNGRNLKLYNFDWRGYSGYGGYKIRYGKRSHADFGALSMNTDISHTENKIYINNMSKGKVRIASETAHWGTYYFSLNCNSHKVVIKGLPEGAKFIVNIYYKNINNGIVYLDENLNTITCDGTYILSGYVSSTLDSPYTYSYYIESPAEGPCDLTIEQLPVYPGALVFDSSDDYAEFVGDLGLNEYTVLFDRLYYNSYKTNRYPLYATLKKEYSKNDIPFKMEFIERNGNDNLSYSYGASTEIDTINGIRKVSVQTSVSYNGKDILRGDSLKKGNGLCLGDSSYLVFYKLLLFDRILTAEQIELAKVKYGFNK